jgi:hypothetical protein
LEACDADLRAALLYDWEEAATDCPACDSRGVAQGSYWLDEAEDYDKETDGSPVSGMVKFTPYAFSCQPCGLRLTNSAELAAAGVPADWSVPEIDVAEFDEYERQLDDEYRGQFGS